MVAQAKIDIRPPTQPLIKSHSGEISVLLKGESVFCRACSYLIAVIAHAAVVADEEDNLLPDASTADHGNGRTFAQ